MRFAVFSDVHGNLLALDACLADLESQGGADGVAVAGDLCLDGPKPKKVLLRLEEIGAACIRGNKDRYVFDDAVAETLTATERAQIAWTRREIGERWLAWLRELPFALRIGEDEAIAFGHLHLPYVRMWRGKLLVNVASVGLPKDGDPRACYAIFTERECGWEVKHRRVAFDVKKVATQLSDCGIPESTELIATLRRHRYKRLKSAIP
ncbi:MAG: metallophosphoesterase family protein [Candidatus Cybelea sp.]